MAEDEFSDAFSTAYDAAAEVSATTLCYPDSADWGCAYTDDELATMQADPAIAVVMARAEALAWSTLASLTGYQLATCPVTVRPCAAGCENPTYQAYPQLAAGIGSTFRPGINNQGYWVNGCGCRTSQACSCTTLSEVYLPGPVGGILDVYVDGVRLDPTAYRVDNNRILVRLDGEEWPGCQDMAAGPTDEGAFAVRYWRGIAPNALTSYAAGVLAAEFYKACSGGKCRLPNGVTSVTRQGVTVEIQTGLWQGGWTGIREVDSVIAMFNPNALKGPVTITSPDVVEPRRTTWQW